MSSPSPVLPLSPDELLSTTRAVRKRLDLERPVSREVIEECIALALQAPSGSNAQGWHFVVVSDADKKVAIADLYRRAFADYLGQPYAIGNIRTGEAARDATQVRSGDSAQYLADEFHRVPAMVIGCISGRTEGRPSSSAAAMIGSITPAMWSFMLAARSRGIGTAWTTLHLTYEREAAEVLGIPYDSVQQVCLTPVAYTLGTDFRPAHREPIDRVVHWDTW